MSRNKPTHEDPRTGGRWVKPRPAPQAYVVRLVQHGGRVHFGIPRKLTEQLTWERGDLVMVEIQGKELRIGRLKITMQEQEEKKP